MCCRQIYDLLVFFCLFVFSSPPVCKFVSIEMKSAFEETGKTKAVIESNYNFIDGKGAPPVKYVKSWVSSSSLPSMKRLKLKSRNETFFLDVSVIQLRHQGRGTWSGSVPVEEPDIETSCAAVRAITLLCVFLKAQEVLYLKL